MIDSSVDKVLATRFLLHGLVQGQGVRPRIVLLATKHSIQGTVCNSFRGVEIKALGDETSLAAFECSLRDEFNDTKIERELTPQVEALCSKGFQIVDSLSCEQLRTHVPLDLVVCEDCLREIRSANNRRSGYPFTTCARCGPRYSIIKRMPFDRESTTMAAFPMCANCRSEYSDLSDRRFHAQTISCPECGPHCWVSDTEGMEITGRDEAIRLTAQRILDGQIAAVKGIGGYQFVCDASNDDAVRRLRRRKQRPTKPLSIMVSDLDFVKQLARVSSSEADALRSPSNPIVLLRSIDNELISCLVSPDLNTIGVMLPTTALHALLLDLTGRPLVVTSGNVHGAALVNESHRALIELSSIADFFLHHDREIFHPIDDSVVQWNGTRLMTIRAARGIAPLSIFFSGIDATISEWSDPPALCATGGHQKVAIAVKTNCNLVLGPHIGDMQTESARVRFQESANCLKSLYQIDNWSCVHDRHSDFYTTHWAATHSRRQSVQHHHAHIAAAMLEHGLLGEHDLEQSVLGFAFDGTGLGDDNTVWGGEALVATATSFQRVGYVRPFRLPGGEKAIEQPWRIAASLQSQLSCPPDISNSLRYTIKHGAGCSSMGRLFDGIASLLLGIESVSYEGEAAMRLESVCDVNEPESYSFFVSSEIPLQFDWRPMLEAILKDIGRITVGCIAMKFHRAVAGLIFEVASRFQELRCVLAGGVFQNRTLLDLIQEQAVNGSHEIKMPGVIPVNDGGLAIGQLVVACSRERHARFQPERNLNCDGDAPCV